MKKNIIEMAQRLVIHPQNPQQRLVRIAADVLQQGGVIIYPTDSAYALGFHIGDKRAMERVRTIRALGKHHNFTLMCRDLSEIAQYAQVSNATFRFLKAHTPGAYTFILPASHDLPKRLKNPKRKTIGIRVPDCQITQMLLAELGEPLMTTTLIYPGDEDPLSDPDEIYEKYHKLVDLVIDAEAGSILPTTVIDLQDSVPRVIREGRGELTEDVLF